MATVWMGDRQIGSDEIRLRAARAAQGLLGLGVGQGDAVAFCLRNDSVFFELGQAAALIGAFTVPINWHYTESEVRYILEDCGARVLLLHSDLLKRLRNAIPTTIKTIVVPTPSEIRDAYKLAEDSAGVAADESWSEWVGMYAPLAAGVSPPPPSAIVYTSGTTGKPKGVKRISPTSAQSDALVEMLMRSYGYLEDVRENRSIATAIIGPIYHSAPYAHANISFRVGADIVVVPRFEPEALLSLIERHRLTHLNMVPIMFNRLLKLPQSVRDSYDLSSLRFIGHAAAPIAPDVKRAMIDWWGPILSEYYGSTETGNLTFCNSEEWLNHPGTVGRAMPNTVLRIVDEVGDSCPPNVPGRIAARNPMLPRFKYHGQADGFDTGDGDLFFPGDVGYLDEDGYLFLSARSNEIIISGGANIYPAEVEAVLQTMPGVADCSIFGIPDEEFGEAVFAAVQPAEGVMLSTGDVLDFLSSRVARYKMPKRVAFHDQLPREDSGKIFKKKLRDPFWQDAARSI